MHSMFIVFFCMFVRCIKSQDYSNPSNWKARYWLVPAINSTIVLPCADPLLYPFTNILSSSVKQVVWILPKSSSYAHVKPGMMLKGYTAFGNSQRFDLEIQREVVSIPESVNGMYLCAALAQLENDSTTFAWFYLRWGVGLYPNVPAMLPGGIERYSRKFTIAGIATLIYVGIAVAIALTNFYRYKENTIEDDDFYIAADMKKNNDDIIIAF